MPDLNPIAAFVEVVRQGSFAGAARALEIPRSTVSARVQALEARLGVRLLKRTTRRTALTDEGRDYHAEVQAAVDTLTAATPRAEGGPLSGTVHLTAPAEYPLDIIGRAAATFARDHPRVSLDVTLTNRTLDFVEDGIDLAIRGGVAGSAGLVSSRLPDVPFGLFASPAYVDRHGRPRDLDDLAAHTLLMFKGREHRRLLGLPPMLETDRRRAEAGLAADSMLMLKQFVVKGLGIAVIPSHLCRQEVRDGTLVRLVPHWSGADVSACHLVFLSRRDIPARVRTFADHLKAAAGSWNEGRQGDLV